MLIILLNIILLITTATATELYCVRYSTSHRNADIDTCFSSKTTPIAAAAADTVSNQNTIDDKNQLTFDLKCSANNDVCAGVKATLTKATDIVSSVFQFESAIHINASFISFCQAYDDCHYDDKMVSIGQAYPTISYIMVDNTDNMTRLYPQALLKQYTNLTVKPNWTPYDIEAQFNSEVNWYFANANNAIQNDQTDFLKNCIHEIMHGLGFMISWGDAYYSSLEPLFENNTLNRFITPYLLASTEIDSSLSNYNANQPFWGFVEYPLDKHIYYTTDDSVQPMSDITRKLNRFQNSNVLFKTLVDLANAWYGSDEYPLAAEIYTKSTTNADVLAMVNNEPILWLETSINPFSTGSSLCHVSQQYINTTEYLMIYTASQGESITQLNQLYPQGPLGPSLLKVMATLGYRINATVVPVDTVKPDISFWSPASDLAGSSLNPSPSLAMDSDGPARVPSTSTVVSSQTSSSDSKKLNVGVFTYLFITLFSCIIGYLN